MHRPELVLIQVEVLRNTMFLSFFFVVQFGANLLAFMQVLPNNNMMAVNNQEVGS